MRLLSPTRLRRNDHRFDCPERRIDIVADDMHAASRRTSFEQRSVVVVHLTERFSSTELVDQELRHDHVVTRTRPTNKVRVCHRPRSE